MLNPTYIEIAADLHRTELERLIAAAATRRSVLRRSCGLRCRMAKGLVGLGWRLDRRAAAIALSRPA